MSATLAPVLYRLGLKGASEQSLELVNRTLQSTGLVASNVNVTSGYSVPADHFLCLQSFGAQVFPAAGQTTTGAGVVYTLGPSSAIYVAMAGIGGFDFAGGASTVISQSGDVWIPPGATVGFCAFFNGAGPHIAQFSFSGVLCPRGNLSLA